MAVHDSINNGYNTYRAVVTPDQRPEIQRLYKAKYYKNNQITMKKYKELNKVAIRKRDSKKVQCHTCGTYTWHSHVLRHKRTAMHARLSLD
jgi:hypothetical protein